MPQNPSSSIEVLLRCSVVLSGKYIWKESLEGEKFEIQGSRTFCLSLLHSVQTSAKDKILHKKTERTHTVRQARQCNQMEQVTFSYFCVINKHFSPFQNYVFPVPSLLPTLIISENKEERRDTVVVEVLSRFRESVTSANSAGVSPATRTMASADSS